MRVPLPKLLNLNYNWFSACNNFCSQDRNEQPTHCLLPLKVLVQTTHFNVVLPINV